MNIFTSYFGNLKNLGQDVVPISIARYNPSYCVNVLRYPSLAPTTSLLRAELSDEAFTKLFTVQLNKQNPQDVVKDLEILSGGKDVVLLCYEVPEDFCHRQVVARWLESHLNIIVKEYPNQKAVKTVKELSLFSEE